MKRSFGKTALVDTGYWIALLDERDEQHKYAQHKAEILRSLVYILPWPTLYETLNTRFARRPVVLERFAMQFFKRPNAKIWGDSPYRVSALEKTLSGTRSLSLVDNVLREIPADRNIRVDYLFTPNVGDFADACKVRNVEVI